VRGQCEEVVREATRPIPGVVETEMQRVVKERVQLETGCPVDRIKVKRVDHLSSTVNAYRLQACETPYVCEADTQTATCRPAPPDEEVKMIADAASSDARAADAGIPELRRPLRPEIADGGGVPPVAPR
jgi:hypothetical protein